jgi:hypothetical protein
MQPVNLTLSQLLAETPVFGIGQMIMFTSDFDNEKYFHDTIIPQIENAIIAESKDVMSYDTRDEMIYLKAKPEQKQQANFEYLKKYKAAGSHVMLLTGITETKILFYNFDYLQAFSRIIFLKEYREFVDRLYHYDGSFWRIWPI